jgi:hypothetical protein
MFSVQHAKLYQRQLPFRPFKVNVVIMGVTNYNPILMRPFREYALKEYNKETEEKVD